jgi:hypothetical protein
MIIIFFVMMSTVSRRSRSRPHVHLSNHGNDTFDEIWSKQKRSLLWSQCHRSRSVSALVSDNIAVDVKYDPLAKGYLLDLDEVLNGGSCFCISCNWEVDPEHFLTTVTRMRIVFHDGSAEDFNFPSDVGSLLGFLINPVTPSLDRAFGYDFLLFYGSGRRDHFDVSDQSSASFMFPIRRIHWYTTYDVFESPPIWFSLVKYSVNYWSFF